MPPQATELHPHTAGIHSSTPQILTDHMRDQPDGRRPDGLWQEAEHFCDVNVRVIFRVEEDTGVPVLSNVPQ